MQGACSTGRHADGSRRRGIGASEGAEAIGGQRVVEWREHPSPLPTRPCYTSPSGMVERKGQMSKVRKSSGRGQESHLPQRYLPDGSRKTISLLFSSFFFLEEERECGNLRDWVQPDSLDSILLGVGSLHGGLGSRARPDVPHGYSTNGRPVEACAVTLPRSKLSLCRVTA